MSKDMSTKTRMIFKYPILENKEYGPVTVEMPKGARVLTVQYQNGVPCIWVEVDWPALNEKRRFQIFGTGHGIPFDAVYIGTIQDPPLVWHLYERPFP